LKKTFSERIHKIPINAGFTCPNRDGSRGVGGCTYCNNVAFNPFYSNKNNDVVKQLDDGIKFYSKRYGVNKFLAYFQAYTNTYGELEELKHLYNIALNHENIIGIILGTRPDCINDELLDYFSELSSRYYISVEYGIESSHNTTLKFINRCHTFEESVDAIKRTSGRGLLTGAHIILGLPGESKEMMIETIQKVSSLALSSLKIHQLQIVKQTVMAKQYIDRPGLFHNYTPGEYVELVVDLLEYLNPSIVIERFISETPPGLIIYPDWKGLRTYDFVRLIEDRLEERDTHQGRLYNITGVYKSSYK
jgi:hypothetical protein